MLEGNSALNEVVSQLSSYSKAIGTALNEWEGYPAAAANFESAAGAVGVSVNLPTISLEIPLIVQSIDTVIGSINEFMDNLQSTAEVIGASLSDLGLNSNIKSGYASSKDPSSLTTLIDGSINGDSTIGGFSYVLADGTFITWYGGDEYSDYDDYIKAVQEQAGEDFDISNIKVLIKSDDTSIAWVDLDALDKGDSQDVSTPTGVTPTDGSSVIDTTPNTSNPSNEEVATPTDEDSTKENDVQETVSNPDNNSNPSTDSNSIIDTSKSKYKTNGYSNLTEEEIATLAYIANQENSGIDGIKVELSLMCNLYEQEKDNYDSVYDYVQNRGWFSTATGGYRNVSNEYYEVAKDVLVNGNHYLPSNVNEHDCLSDIVKAYNGEEKIDVNDRDSYIPGVTTIYNNSGAVYTFIGFAPNSDNEGDPFGYKTGEWL